MPADVKELEGLIRSPEFQALGPQDQLANFRNYLSDQDEEFRGLGSGAQNDAARQIIEYHSPGFASALADVGEYIPIVGGAIRGAREETVRPLTGAIFGQPETTGGRMAAEVARDVGELGAAIGVTKFAMPAINAVSRQVVGRGLEEAIAEKFLTGGAAGLSEAALTAGTTTAARRFAGEAARLAIRERLTKGVIEQVPAAALFGATVALEGEIANGELPPLGDILATAGGAALLGTAFMGAGELMRKFRLRSMDDIVQAAGKVDAERLAPIQRQVSEIADAVSRASGGRMTREGAADLTLTALTEPINAVGDVKLLKDALRARPELLGTEPGLRILRTQRTMTAPDVVDVPGPYLRVTFDDEAGVTKTLDLADAAAQKEFGKRLAKGDIVIDHVVGDQASVLRAGIRPGEPLELRTTPGGARQVVREGTPGDSFEPMYGPYAVPALRPEPANPGFSDLVEQAAREIRTNGRVRPGSQLDLVGHRAAMEHAEAATSAEAISRLAGERRAGVSYAAVDVRGKGRERVVPGTVDRVDARPAPFEVIVKRGATPRDVIVEAGAKVTPAQLKKVRAAEEARFAKEASRLGAEARAGVEPRALPEPAIQQGVLTATGRVFTEPVVPPPQGVVTKATNGIDVKVVTPGDVLGRAVVEMPNGQRIQAQWDPRLSQFDVPHTLLDTLPARPSLVPQLTGEGGRALKPEFVAQVQPGQVISQSVKSLGKNGARPSVEVLAVDGDRVLLRSGDTVVEATVGDVAETVASGNGAFVFDMRREAMAGIVEDMSQRFKAADVFAPTRAVPKLTPEQLAADSQLGETLYSFNTQHAGQRPSPSTLARDTNAGLRQKARQEERVPADQRTQGGSRLVKGCKK